MDKTPNYTEYSLTELLQVQETLDREKFPERAKIVDAEIQRRINAGEKIEEPYSEEDEEESYELIIDFQKGEKTTHRQLFIGTVLLLHALVLGYIWHQVKVPGKSELPEYFINVQKAQCISTRGDRKRHYDLVIKSYGYNFYAIDLPKSRCNTIIKQIPSEADVRIWHHGGVIFHLMLEEKVLLDEHYLRPKYRTNRLARQDTWLALGIIFWVVFFKSFVNAIRPGTFVKEQD